MNRLIRSLGVYIVVIGLLLAGQVIVRAAAQEKPAETEAKPAAGESKQPAAKKPAAEEKKVEAKTPTVSEKKPETQKAQAEEPKAETAETKEKPQAAKPATAKITREPLKVDISLKGVFEATSRSEVVLRPKQWRELTVLKAVDHGQEVRKGDVLVELDFEKIDDQIADVRKDLELSELSLKLAEANLKILEAATPLDLKLAERNKKIVDEDLARFLKVDKPLVIKSADFMLKIAENNLQYEEEELRQLEKMYKADELTEDTEEIILKRQRDAVERARFYFENSKVNHEEALKIDLPREEETRTFLAEQQALLNQRTQATLPVSLEQQRIQMEKMKVERKRAQDRLEELLADREEMAVKSPTDGIVYYGQYVRGQWSGDTTAADSLRQGGTLTRDKVFMTIVKPRPLVVRAEVPESSLHYVKPGLKATVAPTGYPEMKFNATLDAVQAVPLGGQFAATVKVSLPHEAEPLMPGMNCTVKATPYLKKSALVAPASAVFSEKLDEDRKYVYLHREGKKPQKQPVVVGKKSGDKIEILEGLDKGDEILLEEPKEKDA